VTGGHGHGHGHGHGRGHGHVQHEHEHEREPEAHREPLIEGAGEGKTLLLDAFSGIAGDMTIAALVDLGVPFAVVEHAVEAVGVDGARLELRASMAGAIGATAFDVHVAAPDRERSFAEIDQMIRASKLDSRVSELARRIFRRLAEAEARVHRVPVDDVHFHEVGAVDAIVDIVGAAACFVHLGADVACTPLPLGRGSVTCRHGVLPLPAPATVECLAGAPTFDAGIDAELVTPTGAAIAASVATRFLRWPSFAPERIGWGKGSRSLPDRPNALRVVLGVPTTDAPSDAGHVLVECNVDDMTGELAAHAIALLLASGARDAWATPITMKKGRPGLTLAALADHGAETRLAEIMLRETSTIGVRFAFAGRLERPRRMVEVTTRFGIVPVKVSEGPFGPPQLKPEFDVCAKLAAEAGVPVREVLAEALRVYGSG
jgi:pyridinium-3,5-bisthiocarboxylic acid mononucleotide nickel chelatase